MQRKGSDVFLKAEKKHPPSEPGLAPGYSAYVTDALPLELLGLANV